MAPAGRVLGVTGTGMGKQILMNASHQNMMLKEMAKRNMTMNDSTHMIWMEKEQIIPSSTPGSCRGRFPAASSGSPGRPSGAGWAASRWPRPA